MAWNDATKLAAIRARLDGDWDHPALLELGPLRSDPIEDIRRILASEREPRDTTPAPTTTIEFIPQAWVKDHAINVDPQGDTTFEVPTRQLRGLRPNTSASDALKDHPNAPAWVRAWTGPYSLTWAEETPA